MNEIMTIANVRGFIDETGVAQLNAEDVARGFGFTEYKDGKDYVMWRRVNSYLKQFGFFGTSAESNFIPTNGHNENILQISKDDFISENMVYRLGFKASNDTAQKFQILLADEILPSIRKHGAYMTPQKIEEVLLNPDTIIKLATSLKEERAKREQAEQQIEEQKTKVLFADSVAVSRGTMLIRELAKIITQNGYEIGGGRLHQWMRDNGYLIKKLGKDYGKPTQKAAEMKLFEISETTINHNSGVITAKTTARVTGKGQIYFVSKFRELLKTAKADLIDFAEARATREGTVQ